MRNSWEGKETLFAALSMDTYLYLSRERGSPKLTLCQGIDVMDTALLGLN